MIKRLFSLFLIAAAAMGLMVTKPSASDFAQWYIQEAAINTPLNGLLEEVIISQTEAHDYLIVQTFTYQDKTFVGAAGNIFGGTQVKELVETTKKALEDTAKEAMDHVEIK